MLMTLGNGLKASNYTCWWVKLTVIMGWARGIYVKTQFNPQIYQQIAGKQEKYVELNVN